MNKLLISILAAFTCSGALLGGAELTINVALSSGSDDYPRAYVRVSIINTETNQPEWGANLIAKYQRDRTGMSLDEKLDLLRWHLFKLRFIEAERLSEEMLADSGAKDGRVLFSVGIVRVCRGDFEGACRWLRSAEEAGARSARYMRAYLMCSVLESSESEREYINKLITSGEMYASPVALAAVLAFARTDKTGRQAFEMLIARADYSKLSSAAEGLGDVYMQLCKKYGKEGELKQMERLMNQKR